MPRVWSEDDVRRVSEMKSSGMTWSQIGVEFGVSEAAAEKVARRNRGRDVWKTGGTQAASTQSQPMPTPAFDVLSQRLQMENAALRKQLEEKTSPSKPTAVPGSAVVEPLWDGGKSIEELWKEAEDDSVERLEKSRLQGKFKCEFPTNRVVAISFASDQHIAPGTPIDFKRMREDAELIASTPDLYVCLNGDGCDNHLKHSAAIMAARSQPGDQWALYEYYMQIMDQHILVVTAGNHDAWTNQIAGIDMVSKLAKSNRICYAPFEARLECKHGSQNYKIALRHQYRLASSFNQTHAVKQWLRLGDEEFDIGCIGHHHEAAIESTLYRGKEVWCCRPGAYQITSAYSAQYGFNDAIPTCPTFLLFPDKRKIIGLSNVHDAPALLKTFNG